MVRPLLCGFNVSVKGLMENSCHATRYASAVYSALLLSVRPSVPCTRVFRKTTEQMD